MVLGWGSKKAQVQHDDEDMSMEEILASIRKYVADESTAKETNKRSNDLQLRPESPYRLDSTTLPPKTTVSQPEASSLAPKNSFEQSSLFANTSSNTPDEECAVTRDTIQTLSIAPEKADEKKLETSAQHNPFAKLAELPQKQVLSTANNSSGSNASPTLNQLISDLAKPLIQQWLDQNLSRIVEKMVADEIAKMTGNR